MIAIGIVLNLAGLGVLSWLFFTLAVYALPFFVAVTAGLFAYHNEAGSVGAITLALLTGGATLAAAHFAFTLVRAPFLRFVLPLLFAGPAAVAGFYTTHGLAAFTTPSQIWQNIFAVVGALVIGAIAWLRLADAPLDGGTSRADRDVNRRRGLTLT